MKHKTFHSKKENKFWQIVRKIKDPIFSPFFWPLKKLKITPNQISYTGVAFAIIAFLGYENDLILAIFIFLNFMADGLDGAYARHIKKDSQKGALLDIQCDIIGLAFILMAISYNGLVPELWALIYFGLYALLIHFSIFLNKIKKPFRLVFRTRAWISILAFFSLIFAVDLVSPLVIISCPYYGYYIVKGFGTIKEHYKK